jgi:hypothetical protein
MEAPSVVVTTAALRMGAVLVLLIGLAWWAARRARAAVTGLIQSADSSVEILDRCERRIASVIAVSRRVVGTLFGLAVVLEVSGIGLVFWPGRSASDRGDTWVWFLFGGAALMTIAMVVGLVEHPIVRALVVPLRLERLARASRSDPRPPVLLLRSFTQSALWLRHARTHRGRYDFPTVMEFHLSGLATAASAIGPVLAIGDGPLRLFTGPPDVAFIRSTDDSWRAMVTRAVNACRCVLLVPGNSAGLVAEVGLLREAGVMGKTVVFMPPPTRGSYFRVWDEASLRCQWTALRDVFAPHGWALPDYDPDGMLYVPRPDLSIHVAASLQGQTEPASIRSALERLAPHLTELGNRPTSALLADLELITDRQTPGPTIRAHRQPAEIQAREVTGLERGYARSVGTVLATVACESGDGQPYTIVQVRFHSSPASDHVTWCPVTGRSRTPAVGDPVRVRYRASDPLETRLLEGMTLRNWLWFAPVAALGLACLYFQTMFAPWYISVLAWATLVVVGWMHFTRS